MDYEVDHLYYSSYKSTIKYNIVVSFLDTFGFWSVSTYWGQRSCLYYTGAMSGRPLPATSEGSAHTGQSSHRWKRRKGGRAL